MGVGVRGGRVRGRERQGSPFPRSERPEIVEAESLRPARGGHPDEGARVEVRKLLREQHGVVQDVERLGAGQAVAAEAEANTGGRERGDVGRADTDIPVAPGTQSHGRPAPREALAIGGVQLHSVSGDEARVQEPEALGVLDRTGAWRTECHVPVASPHEERRPRPSPVGEEAGLFG